MKIGELFIALGFDVDDKKLKSFNDNVKSARNELFKVSATAGAALFGIQRFVSGSISAATALRNFNVETGNSIESLQKWQSAAVLMNASATADQVSASFASMAENIAAVTFGGGSTGEFARLGVRNVRGQEVGEVIEQIRANLNKTIATYGTTETTRLLAAVGFNSSMINALKLSGDEFDSLVAGRFLKQDRLDSLVKLGDRFTDLTLKITLFKDRLAADIAPALIIFIDQAIPLFKDFKDSLVAVSDAFSTFVSGFDPLMMAEVIGFGSALFIAFNPVTSVFLLLGAAIWDIGRAIRGLPSISGTALDTLDKFADKGILQFLNLMDSEPTSLIGGMKSYLQDKGAGTAIMQGRTEIINNTTFNIQGSNAEVIADEVNKLNQQNINFAYPDQNKGALR